MSVPTNKTISNISQYPLKTARVYFTEKGALAQESVAAATAAATAAANSAAAAGNSASSSAANAAAAATSAANAAAHYATFHNVYYGSFATPPTTRPDGSSRQGGDMYYQNVNISGGARMGLQVWSANDVGVFSWTPSVTTVETIDDRVFALLVPGANIGLSYNDLANTLTISSSVTSTMAGEGFRNYYDTIAKAQLSHIPPEIKAIALMGAGSPGDAGPPMICERRNGPITDHTGWLRSSDRYKQSSNPGDAEDNTNGGYWEFMSKNQPVWIEWFGGRGDYLTVKQDGSGWNPVNPTPTDNHAPIMNASKYVWTTGGNGGIGTGGSIQVGRGRYYVSDTIVLDRSTVIEGYGTGFYHDGAQSFLYFAAGKTGFLLHSSGEGINGAGGTYFRNLYIGSLGYGGQTDKHGVECRAPVFMFECSVAGFGGHGIQIAAGVPTTNANCFGLTHVVCYGNAVDGIFLVGSDANAGFGYGINCMSNGRWGINDQSFLGNYWSGCHTSGNGNRLTGFGGPYRGAFSPIVFDGCYSESDQAPSYAGNHVMFKGGLHGAGIICEGGSFEVGGGHVGAWGISAQHPGGRSSMGFIRAANMLETYYIGSVDGTSSAKYDNMYWPDKGIFLQYNDSVPHWSLGVSPPEGSNFRDPRIQPNSTFIGRGMYLGSTIGGPDNMRQLAFDSSPPDQYAVSYAIGDTSFDRGTSNIQAGWRCISQGVNAPAWVSGTIYNVGDLRRTPSGRVYQVTRVPYDPDRWTMPAITVKPTHTTGTVMYPEPNPEIDLGEASTIPGYTTTVIGDNPLYLPWDQLKNQVWVEGFATRVPETGIAYWCPSGTGTEPPAGYTGTLPYVAGMPVPPTPIFNTPWTMPGSTIEPTHTSGTVEYRQPNPSPSGTEPSTIPGYIWRYVTTDPNAKWMSFGELFIDSPRVSIASLVLNDGQRSSTYTVSAPGAKLGDFARGTSWNPYFGGGSQGLEVVAWVTNDNEAQFFIHNRTGATVNAALMDWYVRVYKGQN